jgi:hypothetical protein
MALREFLQLSKPDLRSAVTDRVPAVFRKAALSWSAIHWTRSDWQSHLSALPNISVQYSATQTFDAASNDFVTYSANVEQTAHEFFRSNFPIPPHKRTEHAYVTTGSHSILKTIEQQQQAAAASSNTYLKFVNQAMGSTNAPQWWNDAASSVPSSSSTSSHLPFAQPFFVDDSNSTKSTKSTTTPQAQARSLLWFSAGPAVAAPHRDAYHNMSVVLAGTKTFALAPPSMHQSFGDRPRKSARYIRTGPGQYKWQTMANKQSEGGSDDDVPYTSGFLSESLFHNATTNENNDNARKEDQTVLVTLLPGDVLYLPYDWYHEVVSTPLLTQQEIEDGVATPMENDFTAAINFWQTHLFEMDMFTDPVKMKRDQERKWNILETFAKQESDRQDGWMYD